MEESLELEVLRENMNKAIRNKDGWLTHWYGSELRFRLNLIEEFKILLKMLGINEDKKD